MKKHEITTSTRERGQGLLEFAVSLIILLLIVAGIIDLGRAFFTYMALRDAAQEGAVYGSFCPHKPTDVEKRVRTSSTNPVDLGDTSSVEFKCEYIIAGSTYGPCTSTGGIVSAGDGLKVTVKFKAFKLSMPFMGMLAGSQTIPISASVTDTVLALECNVGN